MAIIPVGPADKAKHYGGWVTVDERDAAVAEEREACAQLAEDIGGYIGVIIAERIRARANQPDTKE